MLRFIHKKILLIVSLLLIKISLVGCGWEHKIYPGVIVVHTGSAEEIQKSWEKRTGDKTKIKAWANWWNKELCHIYVPPLNTNEDIELWRHELRHCQEGYFHERTIKLPDVAH